MDGCISPLQIPGISSISSSPNSFSIQFFPWPLSIALWNIKGVNPFRKQAGVHPSISLYTEPAKYVFKFTRKDDPEQWADAISELGGAAIADVVLNECMQCGMIAMAEGANTCAACGASQGPSAQDIWSGKWATDFLGQLIYAKIFKTSFCHAFFCLQMLSLQQRTTDN